MRITRRRRNENNTVFNKRLIIFKSQLPVSSFLNLVLHLTHFNIKNYYTTIKFLLTTIGYSLVPALFLYTRQYSSKIHENMVQGRHTCTIPSNWDSPVQLGTSRESNENEKYYMFILPYPNIFFGLNHTNVWYYIYYHHKNYLEFCYPYSLIHLLSLFYISFRDF